jgi:hypothetical protein
MLLVCPCLADVVDVRHDALQTPHESGYRTIAHQHHRNSLHFSRRAARFFELRLVDAFFLAAVLLAPREVRFFASLALAGLSSSATGRSGTGDLFFVVTDSFKTSLPQSFTWKIVNKPIHMRFLRCAPRRLSHQTVCVRIAPSSTL